MTPYSPPLHNLYVYSVYLFTQGKGEELTREQVREAIVHKAGLYLQSINSIKHQKRPHLGFGVFIVTWSISCCCYPPPPPPAFHLLFILVKRMSLLCIGPSLFINNSVHNDQLFEQKIIEVFKYLFVNPCSTNAYARYHYIILVF
jgi:hypothetical protein